LLSVMAGVAHQARPGRAILGHVGDDPEILRDRSALEAILGFAVNGEPWPDMALPPGAGSSGPYRKASIRGRYLKSQAPP